MAQSGRVQAIAKELSPNDTGETGGHQAGILVPKDQRILSFFPSLDDTELNPRSHLVFHEPGGTRWEFAFIYYNNSRFSGTRNEYRLTRMTAYIRQHGLRAGDKVILTRDPESMKRQIEYQRGASLERSKGGVLKLGSGWREVKF